MSVPPKAAAAPRIGPGSTREIGLLATAIARIGGRVTGTGPLNVFTTLARHRGLFLPWLWFAGRLMPRGRSTSFTPTATSPTPSGASCAPRSRTSN